MPLVYCRPRVWLLYATYATLCHLRVRLLYATGTYAYSMPPARTPTLCHRTYVYAGDVRVRLVYGTAAMSTFA